MPLDLRTRIADVPFGRDESRFEPIRRANRTDAPIPDGLMHDLIAARAREAPDHPAVVDSDGVTSYAELEAESNALAHELIAAGVRPDTLVAVMVPPSASRLIAILGVHKAGGAYVPLDAAYPVQRLRFILEDTAAPVLIAQALGGLDTAGLPLTVLDASPAARKRWRSTRPSGPPRLAERPRAAYVIYTSGSTGRPKGVALPHTGLVNRIDWMRRELGVEPSDRILHKTPFGFDVSVWELFLPLASGATEVIAPQGAQRDAEALAELIARERVTIAHFVPSLLEAFVELARPCPSLRAVVASGEALPRALERRFHEAYPCDLYNFYGPTEATIDVTFWRCERDSTRAHVPIGRPIANTQIYVLDDELRLLPAGAVGELCIGGVGVGLGYLNQPDLTSERFVPDPFRPGPSARLYRTGDLARFAADGTLEFLGRKDHQVKLRGFRIELGEVESVLLEHPAVRQAAVVLRADAGSRRLVAYVTWKDAPEPAEDALLRFLASRLPDYMVPSAIVSLAAFPLTPSGKIDRAALPAPLEPRPSSRPPQGPAEEALAALWRDLLGLAAVGADDHFFRVGGDSIQTIRLAARARERGLQLSVKQIFDNPTLASMAAAARPAAPGGEEVDDTPLLALTLEDVQRRLGLADVEDAYPLAPMQSGLLFRGIYWPGSDSYFNQNVLELRGPLDPALLRAAFQAVADHYPILRTGFVWEDVEEPFQYVRRGLQVPWEEHDWRGVDPAEIPARLEDLLARDRERGFDLRSAPLLRMQVVCTGPGAHYVVWSHHHVLIDGWCLALIWGGVFRAYEQLRDGGRVSLEPSRPYRDYIRWLRRQSVSGAAERFWRGALQGFCEPTRFSPRSDLVESVFSTRELVLAEGETRALGDRGRAQGVTINTLVQAAWALLLSSQAHADDVVFGVSVSGRPPELSGVEKMVGLFINTIPLRIRIDRRRTVGELLDEVQRSMTAAAEHGHVPLAQIKAWSEAAGRDGRPLFDSLIAFENYPEDALPVGRVGGVEIRDVKAVEKTEYPIGLIALPGPALALHLNYDTSHFSARAIEWLGDRLRHLLAQMAAAPDRKVEDLAPMSPAERSFVLEASRGPEPAWRLRPVHELFDDVARRHPGASAILDGRGEMSYRELAAAADGLAHHLRSLGIAPGERVAVHVGPSRELAAALLATLKAGAAYVPLEPSAPPARLAWMIEDAAPRVLLTQAPSGALAASFAGHLVPLDLSDPRWGPAPAKPLDAGVDAGDIAYVMYTSGTTGRPKGVLCQHGGLSNRLQWTLRAWPTKAPPRLLQNAGIGFDISVWEMLFPLLAGGQLVIPEGAKPDLDGMLRTMAQHAVSVVHWVPSLLELFVEHPEVRGLSSLEHVVSGGEVLSPRQVRAFWDLGLSAELHHAYGPTEASISVTHWQADRAELAGDRTPLGHPMAGTSLYVLDERQRLAAVGVSGEIYLGGACLARGYLNEPRLTDATFICASVAGEPSQRLYRTGDRGRLLAEGRFEFLGRVDGQLKIRGQRIEPEEVEAVLHEHGAVRRVAVVPVRNGRGDAGLLALCAAAPGARAGAALAAELRSWLEDRLPPASLPAVRWVDQLPLTGTGKLDRRAAAALATAEAAPARANGAPRNGVEARMAEIWAQVLGVERVGIHDSFFELGGHSLLMLRLAAEMRRAFPELPMDVTQVFKAPTIAELSVRLSRKHQLARHPVALLGRAGGGTPLFLVHPGEGIAVAYRAVAPLLDRPLYGIDNPRFGDAGSPFTSVEEMALAYISLVHQMQASGPYALGGWSFGGLVALEMARALRAANEQVEAVVLVDTHVWMPGEAPGADLDRIGDDLRRRGVDPSTPDGKAIAFEVFHNGTLASRYRPARYDGPVALLCARDGAHARAACGWEHDVLPDLQVFSVPGRHRDLFAPERAATTAQALAAGLRQEGR
jgi:nocardicin nonribosomal peptide synthetase NocB